VERATKGEEKMRIARVTCIYCGRDLLIPLSKSNQHYHTICHVLARVEKRKKGLKKKTTLHPGTA
jgi:hypothetical protein